MKTMRHKFYPLTNFMGIYTQINKPYANPWQGQRRTPIHSPHTYA